MFQSEEKIRTKGACCCPEGSEEGIITSYKPKGTFS